MKEKPLWARLEEAGLSEDEARRKDILFERAQAALAPQPGPAASETLRFFVPGRIEVLGKHTDYAGGRSLLAAAERGLCVAAAPREDRLVRITSAGRGATITVSLDPEPPAPVSGWGLYASTAARRLIDNFAGPWRGADVGLASDLPAAAGLSSSSALVIALFAVLAAVNRLDERSDYRAVIRSPEDLAGYLGAIEAGRAFGPWAGDAGAGALIGSEDHTAILCARAGDLSQYAFLPVRLERSVRLPSGWTFAVAASGVAADKTGAARESYNRLSRSADAIRQVSGTDGRSLLAAIIGTPDGAERIRGALSGSDHPEFSAAELLARFEQFLEETTRLIPEAGDALADRNVGALGPLADRSQELAERVLRNQVPQTTFLARCARELGAAAASAFGAGFGGSVWALAETAAAEGFLLRWRERYLRAFPGLADRCDFFATRPGPPLLRF